MSNISDLVLLWYRDVFLMWKGILQVKQLCRKGDGFATPKWLWSCSFACAGPWKATCCWEGCQHVHGGRATPKTMLGAQPFPFRYLSSWPLCSQFPFLFPLLQKIRLALVPCSHVGLLLLQRSPEIVLFVLVVTAVSVSYWPFFFLRGSDCFIADITRCK